MSSSKSAPQTLAGTTSQKRNRHEALCEPRNPNLDDHEKRMAKGANRVAVSQSHCVSLIILRTDTAETAQGRNYVETKRRLPHGTLEGVFVANIEVASAEYEYPWPKGKVRKYQAILYHWPLNKKGQPERQVVTVGDTAENDIDARWKLIGKLIAGVMLECSRETAEVVRRQLIKDNIQTLTYLLGEMSTDSR